MKWRKWISRLETQSGYVLLESLVSLSLVTFVLLVTVPLVVSLIEIHEKNRILVEIDRVLLDQSETWEPGLKREKVIESYNIPISVTTTDKGIEVRSEHDHKKKSGDRSNPLVSLNRALH